MKKIVSLFSFLFFLIFSNSILAEVDIELLKQKYPKCENENYRHECFDDAKEQNFSFIGYFRNNSLWDGKLFQNDILTFEYVDGEQIAKSFCEEKYDGWVVCPSGNRYKPIEDGYFDEDGLRQGKFIFEWQGGNKYVGEYKDDLSHGKGTYTFADGRKEVGEWENDNLNGYAIQYNSDGTIRREGIFKDDEFLYAETKEKKEPSKLDKYKSTCEELGFVPGTEKFGDCVMKLMDKD